MIVFIGSLPISDLQNLFQISSKGSKKVLWCFHLCSTPLPTIKSDLGLVSDITSDNNFCPATWRAKSLLIPSCQQPCFPFQSRLPVSSSLWGFAFLICVLLTSYSSFFWIDFRGDFAASQSHLWRWTESTCCFCHGSAASLASTRPPPSGIRSLNGSENTNECRNICRPPIPFR